MGKALYTGRSFLLLGLSFLLMVGCTHNAQTQDPGQGGVSLRSLSSGTGQAEAEIRDLTGTAKVVADIGSAVVGISTLSVTRSLAGGEQALEGLGSGIVADPSGLVLTNHHVAGTADRIAVVWEDGSQQPAKRIWSDPVLDLAILQLLEGDTPYPSAPLGDSDRVWVGDPVIAIGTPLTLQFQHTVTQGIISAKNRTLQVPTDLGENIMEDLLQTDASINPGNSGGPLLDAQGRVIGINTVKVAEAEGIGFAIPINIAKPILRHFVEEGTYTQPYIGLFAMDNEMARFYLEDTGSTLGLTVLQADAFGPAYAAGIRRGDILLSVDGTQLRTMLQLRIAIYEHKVGDHLRFRVARRQSDGSLTEWDVNIRLVTSPGRG